MQLAILARVRVLMTKLYRGKYQNVNSALTVCGNGEFETGHHVVLECKRLNPLEEESYLARALGR